MNMFTWLLMGHLVADWCLQNDWMAAGKVRGRGSRALAVHCGVYTITVGGAFWMASNRTASFSELVVVGGFLFLSHWCIDGFDLARVWGRVWRQTDSKMVRLGVDQTLHLVVLAGLAEGMG